MPNNFKVIEYVLGFENSDYLFADFQFHYYNKKDSFCSKKHYHRYESLDKAKEAYIGLKNISGLFFHSMDESYSLEDIVEGKTDDDFYIEQRNDEEGFFGCKWPKLPFKVNDLKIFVREVEVTYTQINQ